MDNETRQKLDKQLELFRDNPSNSNKYRHEIYALVEEFTNDCIERLAASLEASGYKHATAVLRDNKLQ